MLMMAPMDQPWAPSGMESIAAADNVAREPVQKVTRPISRSGDGEGRRRSPAGAGASGAAARPGAAGDKAAR